MRHRALIVFAAATACAAPASRTASPSPIAPSAASAATVAPVVAPPAAKARVDLVLRKTKAFLGENVLVDFCLVNTSGAPFKIDVGGDYRGSSRSLRFKLKVTDAHGSVMADPDPNPMNFGGLSYSPEVAPGASWCQSLPLMRYARIDAPGTYTVEATHDLGWKTGAPTGRVKLELAMPTAAEAEGVVAAMAALPADPNRSAGKTSVDYADFSTLRYDVYTAPLTARAARGDLRAIEGLANIPSEAATRALVGLLGNASQGVGRAAAQGLAMRLPDPQLAGNLPKRNPFENSMTEQRKYLARAWVPALADAVRAAAHQRLASTNDEDVKDGAFMLEALGTPADGPELVKALDVAIAQTRAVAPEANVYPPPRGATQELLRAAEMLVDRKLAPPNTPKTAGELALWLVALRGAKPAGWEMQLGRAMRHPTPYVRELAFARAPSLPASLLPLVSAGLADRDRDVVVAAAQLAAREHATSLAPLVVRAMARQNDIRLNAVSAAAYELGARYDRARMLASMLDSAATFQAAIGELLPLLDEHGWSSNAVDMTDADRRKLAARWSAFVAAHRADIEAARPVATSDPSVTPDLLPPGTKLRRGDGTEWP